MPSPRWVAHFLSFAALLALALSVSIVDSQFKTVTSRTALLEQGAKVYAANCQVCHGDRTGNGKVKEAPSHGPSGHTWSHRDRSIIQRILNGSPTAAPSDGTIVMPGWNGRLSEQEITAVVSLMKTWWTAEQRALRDEWYGCRDDVTPSC